MVNTQKCKCVTVLEGWSNASPSFYSYFHLFGDGFRWTIHHSNICVCGVGHKLWDDSQVCSAFLPTCPPRGAWVNRWTFSPFPPSSPSSSPHHQLFVPTQPKKSSSFVPTRPKKAQVLFLPGREKLKFLFLGGAWVFGCVCHLVLVTTPLTLAWHHPTTTASEM